MSEGYIESDWDEEELPPAPPASKDEPMSPVAVVREFPTPSPHATPAAGSQARRH